MCGWQCGGREAVLNAIRTGVKYLEAGRYVWGEGSVGIVIFA